MRSRLEAIFAAMLDRAGIFWVYEPGAFADQNGSYLPDFYLPGMDYPARTVDTYVEVKPRSLLDGEQAAYWQRRMEIIWSSEPDAVLRLWFEGIDLWGQGGVWRAAW